MLKHNGNGKKFDCKNNNVMKDYAVPLTIHFFCNMVALDHQLLTQRLHILRPGSDHSDLSGGHLIRVVLFIQAEVY